MLFVNPERSSESINLLISLSRGKFKPHTRFPRDAPSSCLSTAVALGTCLSPPGSTRITQDAKPTQRFAAAIIKTRNFTDILVGFHEKSRLQGHKVLLRNLHLGGSFEDHIPSCHYQSHFIGKQKVLDASQSLSFPKQGSQMEDAAEILSWLIKG